MNKLLIILLCLGLVGCGRVSVEYEPEIGCYEHNPCNLPDDCEYFEEGFFCSSVLTNEQINCVVDGVKYVEAKNRGSL